MEVTIDLQSRTLSLPGGKKFDFPVDGFARYCLLNGLDELDFILEQEQIILAFEKKLIRS